MTFTFNLQNVLDFQNMKEDEARMLCEQLQNTMIMHSTMLMQLEEKLAEAQERMYANPTSSNILWLEEQYIQSLRADIENTKHSKEKVEKELVQQQEHVMALAQKTKSMDSLKNKRKELYMQEKEQKEQKELDAMTTMRYKNETH